MSIVHIYLGTYGMDVLVDTKNGNWTRGHIGGPENDLVTFLGDHGGVEEQVRGFDMVQERFNYYVEMGIEQGFEQSFLIDE